MKHVKYLVWFCCFWLAVPPARAVIEIEITKGLDSARPIAVIPFATREGVRPPVDVAMVVNSDLRRSGRFRPMPLADLPERPFSASAVQVKLWQEKGIEAVLVGTVKALPDGDFEVGFELVDPFRSDLDGHLENGELVVPGVSVLVARTARVPAEALRKYAHHISDVVYETLTGVRGAFSTKIAYVGIDRTQTNPYQLFVADADGYAPFALVKSRLPIMSPAWSPDGQQLAYVSFEGRRSAVVVQHVYTGERRVVSRLPGINGAPSWSPDGKRLALTLSKDGNPEIYMLELDNLRLTRLTRNSAIDTEPAWYPDGTAIAFTSDRGGSPQIYRMNLVDRKATRLTFQGNYNAGASFTADGRQMVLVHRATDQFHIAIMEMQTGLMQELTETWLDESPSVAPNGSMIIYATLSRGRRVLAAVSTDGRFRAILPSSQGEVRAPAWSPFLN